MAEAPAPYPVEEEEEGYVVTLQHWVLAPDDRYQSVETPLTREIFLNPPPIGKMLEGELHNELRSELNSLIWYHLRSRRDDVLVLSDVKHFFDVPDLPAPAPDLSVVFGIRRHSPLECQPDFSVEREGGIRPSLILEILCPFSREIREADKVDKVEVYRRAGIPEYVLVETPLEENGFQFNIRGYCLDSEGSYQPMEKDSQGRIISKTTNLGFFASLADDWVILFDMETGKELLPGWLIDKRAEREAEALRALEDEITRLRGELERLKGGLPVERVLP